MSNGTYTADSLTFGGPGQPPSPWVVQGPNIISYDGAIMIPAAVTGGPMGSGTINVNDLYIQGVRLETYVGQYLPLTGGTLSGPLVISGTNNLFIGGNISGLVLASDGANGTYWTNLPPGGPYLQLVGGVMTGPLSISDASNFLLGGGNPGQVLSTDGESNLSWTNPGGSGSLPGAGPIGYFLATDGGTQPYWTNVVLPLLTLQGNDETFGQMNVNDPIGTFGSFISGSSQDKVRWIISLNDGTAETGSNAGSNFNILNYADDGVTLLGMPLQINRATGLIIIQGDPTTALGISTKQYVDNKAVPVAGGTMTGPLILSADPTVALGAVTKEYVDNKNWGQNKIINGDFYVDQRNNGASGTATGYTMDRWSWGATQVGKITWQRVTWSPTGFPGNGFIYSAYLTTTTAYPTLAAGDYFCFGQIIEADMITDLFWGTQAGGYPATLSFYVYATQAGTYSAAIRNAANTRSYVVPFTIASANWQKVVITIPPDNNIGSWVLNGNAAGLSIYICFGIGTTYATSSANTWLNGNYLGITGQTNMVADALAEFYLTGVKFELGSIATPFRLETLSKRIQDCQRYYQVLNNMICTGNNAAGQYVWNSFPFPTLMRAVPTVTFVSTAYSNASALTTNGVIAMSIMTRIVITAAGVGYATFGTTLSAEL